MTMLFLKRTLNAALLLAAIYGLGHAVHNSTLHKVVSPIASAVWGSYGELSTAMKPMNKLKTLVVDSRLRLLAILLVAFSAQALFAAASPAANNAGKSNIAHFKFAKDLNYGHSNGLVDVIVQYRQTPTSAHYSRMASRGASVKSRLHSIHAAAFRIPASAIPLLEKDPDVLYVTPDRPLQLSSVAYEPYNSA